MRCLCKYMTTLKARFMGPTWGPPGSCRPQMGPMLAPWTAVRAVTNDWASLIMLFLLNFIMDSLADSDSRCLYVIEIELMCHSQVWQQSLLSIFIRVKTTLNETFTITICLVFLSEVRQPLMKPSQSQYAWQCWWILAAYEPMEWVIDISPGMDRWWHDSSHMSALCSWCYLHTFVFSMRLVRV